MSCLYTFLSTSYGAGPGGDKSEPLAIWSFTDIDEGNLPLGDVCEPAQERHQ